MKITILARWYSSTEEVIKLIGINEANGDLIEGIEDGEGLCFNKNNKILYLHPAIEKEMQEEC